MTRPVLASTETKAGDKGIAHRNRVLLASRKVNQLIVREKDAERLIHETCKLLVEHLSYGGVMIIFTGADGRAVQGRADRVGKGLPVAGGTPQAGPPATLLPGGVAARRASPHHGPCRCLQFLPDAGGLRCDRYPLPSPAARRHDLRVPGDIGGTRLWPVDADEQSLLIELAGDRSLRSARDGDGGREKAGGGGVAQGPR